MLTALPILVLMASPPTPTQPVVAAGERSLVSVRWLESSRPSVRVEEPLRWVDGVPTKRTRWFDAATGVELLRREHVVGVHGRVLPTNPISTPEPVLVPLEGVEGPGMLDDDWQVWGCSAEPISPALGTRVAGTCYPRRLAEPNAAGNYEPDLPGIDFEASGPIVDDAYAELAVYHHARTFEVWREQWEDAAADRCPHGIVQTNFVRLESTGFRPVDGAYYTGSCEADTPRFVFGQGAAVDYAYDADVVHHELAHGVVDDITASGLWRQSCDEVSCGAEARAINEGIADFIAASINGDAHIGEYVVGDATAGIRNLDEGLRCPDDLEGDPYHDSQILSGALWSARQRVGERLDGAIMATVASLSEDARFEDFVRVISEVAAQQLGDADQQALALAMDDAGLSGCVHVRPVVPGDDVVLVARPVGVSSPWPGPVQLRYEVPDGMRRAELLLRASAAFPRSADAGAELPDEAGVVVWIGDADPVALDQHEDAQGRLRIEPSDGREVELVADADGLMRLVVDVPPGAGALHLVFANPLPHIDIRLEVVDSTPLLDGVSGCRFNRRPSSPWLVLTPLVVALLSAWRTRERMHPR
ncbi:MAG: hypothetical protein K0V04_42255 [Deltaproteobacteria bacterium]|nr:hypothetical protein [Deltaproteobacteria bacterium]